MKTRKLKTRKKQTGGNIGNIIGATAIGAFLLWGASQLSRKTKKPLSTKYWTNTEPIRGRTMSKSSRQRSKPIKRQVSQKSSQTSSIPYLNNKRP